MDEKKTRILSIGFYVVVAVVAIAITLHFMGYGRSAPKNPMLEKAVAAMTPAAMGHKEYPLSYVKSSLTVCMHDLEQKHLSSQQQIDYCACYVSAKMEQLTTKDLSEMAAARGNLQRAPDAAKKLSDIAITCQQKMPK